MQLPIRARDPDFLTNGKMAPSLAFPARVKLSASEHVAQGLDNTCTYIINRYSTESLSKD